MYRQCVFLCCMLFVCMVCGATPEDEKLLGVQVVFRHGDRAPVTIMPSQQGKWDLINLRAGELSEIGVDQAKALGDFLKTKYQDELKFIDERDYWNVSAVSTDVDRTISTVNVILREAFNDIQKTVPVRTEPGFTSDMAFWNSCPSYAAEKFGNSIDFSTKADRDPKTMKKLRSLTGFTDPNVTDSLHVWKHLFDNIRCMEAHKILVPEEMMKLQPDAEKWYKSVCFADYIWQGATDKRGLGSSSLAARIIQNFQDIIDGKGVKMHLFSAHDNTITGVYDLLGAIAGNSDDQLAPTYVSTVIFELWDTRVSGVILNIKTGAPAQNSTPPDGTWTFHAENQEFRCETSGGLGVVCPFVTWQKHIASFPGFQHGCCLQTNRFFEYGCDKYTAADSDIHYVCRVYRQMCPTTACGADSVYSSPTGRCLLNEPLSPDGNELSSETTTIVVLSFLLAASSIGIGLLAYYLFRMHSQLKYVSL